MSTMESTERNHEKDESPRRGIKSSKDEENEEIEEIQDTALQQEKKKYINFFFCQISISILSTYFYIFMSICYV